MAWQHDTMMNPPIEGLLTRADSKFRLVTLGAKRARQARKLQEIARELARSNSELDRFASAVAHDLRSPPL